MNQQKYVRFSRPERFVLPALGVSLIGAYLLFAAGVLTEDMFSNGAIYSLIGLVIMACGLGGMAYGHRGVSKREKQLHKENPYYEPKVGWSYPLPLRVSWLIVVTIGFGVTVILGAFPMSFLILMILLQIGAVFFALLGRWRKMKSFIADFRERRRKKSEGEVILARFTGQTLYSAGFSAESPDSLKDRVIPEILEKKIDGRDLPRVRVEVIQGRQTVGDYEKGSESLASAWGVKNVIVENGGIERLTKGSRHTVWLTGLARETVLDPNELVLWKNDRDESMSIAEYVSSLFIGMNALTGDEYRINLAEKNFLIGGLPGSGKSALANALIGLLILHPDVRVQIIDLKNGVEAKAWEDAVSGTVDNSFGTEQALQFLKEANKDIQKRYFRMSKAGVTNAWTEGFLGPEEPLKLIIVDETSRLFNEAEAGGEKMAAACLAEMQKIVEQGRAAGYVLIMSTQYPVTANLPTRIRENASDAICLKVKGAPAMMSTLGSEFMPTPTVNPTKLLGRGDAIIVNGEHSDGVRVQFAFLDSEKKAEVITQSKIGGTHWLDDHERWDELVAETLKRKDDLMSGDLDLEPEAEEPKDDWTFEFDAADAVGADEPVFAADELPEVAETAVSGGGSDRVNTYAPEPISAVEPQTTDAPDGLGLPDIDELEPEEDTEEVEIEEADEKAESDSIWTV